MLLKRVESLYLNTSRRVFSSQGNEIVRTNSVFDGYCGIPPIFISRWCLWRVLPAPVFIPHHHFNLLPLFFDFIIKLFSDVSCGRISVDIIHIGDGYWRIVKLTAVARYFGVDISAVGENYGINGDGGDITVGDEYYGVDRGRTYMVASAS